MGAIMRVLVVEDEPLMASFIARGLGDNGYAVDVAPDGRQAFAKVKNQNYDLVILDLRLPVKDGLTVCRELREQCFRFPILMLTALDSVDDVVNGLNSGADDYLAKPFDFELLLARIRALLRRGRQLNGDVLQVADLSLNTLDHTATRSGRPISRPAEQHPLVPFFMLYPAQLFAP